MTSLQVSDIRKIAELLKKGEDSSSDSEDDVPRGRHKSLCTMGPGDVGAARPAEADPLAIWRQGEADELPATADDPRPQPRHELLYRQRVGAEDVFLQLGAKTPASASCEALVVRVELPGERRDAVQLQASGFLPPAPFLAGTLVTREQLTVRSPRHFLHLPLPHPVKPDGARASWDPHTSTLTVAVDMDRELDFLNM
ncbi:dynein axonemal assembly factor 6 [Bacillus rossius redtenbacheri]|uniref:dynein axonemal assembly factor 6 n=1 Tax=Bacillus rossius redtenbacheri TaxID=93214 RepID=UPI002FDE1743